MVDAIKAIASANRKDSEMKSGGIENEATSGETIRQQHGKECPELVAAPAVFSRLYIASNRRRDGKARDGKRESKRKIQRSVVVHQHKSIQTVVLPSMEEGKHIFRPHRR